MSHYTSRILHLWSVYCITYCSCYAIEPTVSEFFFFSIQITPFVSLLLTTQKCQCLWYLQIQIKMVWIRANLFQWFPQVTHISLCVNFFVQSIAIHRSNCSHVIYLQCMKVSRSVMLSIGIQSRSERASSVGHEQAAVLIIIELICINVQPFCTLLKSNIPYLYLQWQWCWRNVNKIPFCALLVEFVLETKNYWVHQSRLNLLMTRMQIQVQTQAMSTRNAIQSQWVRYTNVHLEQLCPL